VENFVPSRQVAILSGTCAVEFSAPLRKTQQNFFSTPARDFLSTFLSHLSHAPTTGSSHKIHWHFGRDLRTQTVRLGSDFHTKIFSSIIKAEHGGLI